MRAERAVPAILAILALAALATGAGVVVARIGFPFELEWMEGLCLEQIARARAGLPVYVPPSVSYAPLNYPPLYFELAAFTSRIVGEGFLAARLVSALASLLTAVLCGWLAARETRSAFTGLLAAGLFAATARWHDHWFDIARPDALYMLLVFASVAALRIVRLALPGGALAGVVLALAFFTKQSAAVAIAPLILWLLLLEPRRALALLVTFVPLVLGGLAALDRSTGGWHGYYAFSVAAAHHPTRALVLPTLRDDVVPLMPLFALFVWAMSATLRHPRTGAVAKDSRTGLQALRAHVAGTPMLFWAAAAAGPLASGLFLRLYPGGWMNVLLAAAPFVALLGALAFDALRPAATGRPAGFVAAGLLIAQFACLADLPASVVPSAEDREAGERVVAAIRADAGEVLVLAHPDLARRAGKAGSVHEIMLLDVRALGDSSARRLERELLEGFVSRRWSAIVLDHGEEAEWPFRIAARDYAVAETLAIPRDAFWTKSGARTRPETIWRPRPSR